jgi:hypothetical protein
MAGTKNAIVVELYFIRDAIARSKIYPKRQYAHIGKGREHAPERHEICITLRGL